MMTRRNALKLASLATVAIVSKTSAAETPAAPPAAIGMEPKPVNQNYPLPDLPYPFEALEPHIDTETMRIHHNYHHRGYAINLGTAMAKHPELANRPAEELLKHLDQVPGDIRRDVHNFGGGYVNHNLFWKFLTPKTTGAPQGDLAAAISKKFTSFDAFKEQFTKEALGLFGSGWTWLTSDVNKQLRIESLPNQDCPLSFGRVPLLGIDVWEHAYYLKYRNRRADYVKAFFSVINWEFAAKSFETGVVK